MVAMLQDVPDEPDVPDVEEALEAIGLEEAPEVMDVEEALKARDLKEARKARDLKEARKARDLALALECLSQLWPSDIQQVGKVRSWFDEPEAKEWKFDMGEMWVMQTRFWVYKAKNPAIAVTLEEAFVRLVGNVSTW